MSWMSPLTVPITTLPIRSAPGLGEQRAQDRHAGLHRVGGEQHLGDEQDAVAEVDADDAHALDERVVQHLVGRPAALEQDVRALDDLVGEAVVEVVVHLRDELVVGSAAEVDLVVGHAAPFVWSWPSRTERVDASRTSSRPSSSSRRSWQSDGRAGDARARDGATAGVEDGCRDRPQARLELVDGGRVAARPTVASSRSRAARSTIVRGASRSSGPRARARRA